jgi:hypothetical protein
MVAIVIYPALDSNPDSNPGESIIYFLAGS